MSRLIVRVRDQGGTAVPARLSVRSLPDQLPHWPVTEHLRYDIVEPWGQERSFVCDGEATLELPQGEYKVVAARGPEFREWHSSVTVEPERTTVAEAVVSRWIDLPGAGWYSGDLHVHRPPHELPLLLLAEDIHVGSSIASHLDIDGPGGRGVMEGPALASEPGPAVHRIDASHLYSTTDIEVERIMGGPGAIIGLGSSAPPRLRASAWEPFDDAVSDMVREAGGHVDGEKVFWPSIPVLAALGKLDSVELACNHFGQTWTHWDIATAGGFEPESGIDSPRALADWIFELYYALLGCGFHLPASGGSGAGVMPNPVGASRTYARLDGPLEHGTWLEAVRRGRTFSTNGPLIELDVDGCTPGETVVLDGRRRLPVRIRASAAHPLAEIGLVVDGTIVDEWHPAANGAATVEVEAEVEVSGASWVGARAFERHDDHNAIRFAHTSPVWLDTPAERIDRTQPAALVGSWLDWTDGLATAAERATGRTLDGARQAVVRARQVVEAQVAASGGNGR